MWFSKDQFSETGPGRFSRDFFCNTSFSIQFLLKAATYGVANTSAVMLQPGAAVLAILLPRAKIKNQWSKSVQLVLLSTALPHCIVNYSPKIRNLIMACYFPRLSNFCLAIPLAVLWISGASGAKTYRNKSVGFLLCFCSCFRCAPARYMSAMHFMCANGITW